MEYTIQSEIAPVFIVGNSRSGTTLMSRILNNSEAIFTFEELHFFEEMWIPKEAPESLTYEQSIELTSKLLNIQRNGYLSQKNPADYINEAHQVLNGISDTLTPLTVFSAFLKYESHLNGKARPCEQTPRNVLYISEILKLYPHARIINMVRDPRDILLSQKRRWKRPFLSTNIPKIQALRYWMNYHPITISKLWNVNATAGKKFEDESRFYSLRFEDLVEKPEESVHKICDFLEISFHKDLLSVPQVGSSNESDVPNRKGIDKGKVSGWRRGGLNSAEVFICEKMNRDLMLDYNYQLEKISPNYIVLALSSVFFPIKIFLSLMLNLNRIKNIQGAIVRRLS